MPIPPVPPVDPAPVGPSGSRPTLRQFPSHFRLNPGPYDPFALRWPAKRADADALARDSWVAFDALRARLPGFRIPDAVWDNWRSRWVQDLFVGFIQSSDRLPPLTVAAAVEDVRAGVAALRYVMANGIGERSGTFWASVFPSQVGFPHLPTVEEVRRHHPAFFLRAESGRSPDGERPELLDAGQFLNRLSFLLNEPTEADWAWLERVAYQIDPVQPCENPAPPESWARRIFPEVIPGLSLCLEISYDPHIVDPGTPLPVLVAHVHSWYLTAREAVQRQVKNATQALTPVIPPTLTAAPLNPLPIMAGKGKHIDARMLKVMAENPESHGWTAQQWADHLQCSAGTVKETKTWTERLAAARATAAADAASKMDRSGTRPSRRRKAQHKSDA